MLLQRSRLLAASAERPRLISPWAVAALAGLTVVALVAMYPFKALVQQVVAINRGDPLTTSYLHNLLRTDPQNPELRLMLARQQFAEGALEPALTTLAPALRAAQAEVRRDANWLAWRIRARLAEVPDARPGERERRRVDLLEELRRIAAEPWADQVLLEMARQALALGQTELAIELYRRAGEAGGRRDAGWYADGAAYAIGIGEYRVAARLYLLARSRSVRLEEQRAYFLSALHALSSGNLVREAAATAERELGDLENDQQTLLALVELARAADRIDLADKYVRLLLRLAMMRLWQQAQFAAAQTDRDRVALAQPLPAALIPGPSPASGRRERSAPLSPASGGEGVIVRVAAPGAAASGPQTPFDDRLYSLGYEVFLANRKVEDAYRVAASAVRQVPNDLTWRRRHAQAAEWTGRPQEALASWLAVAQASAADDAWQAVLRLAPGLFDDRALIAALNHELQRGKRDARLLARLLEAYERIGAPEEGLALLERLHGARPQPELLETMAELAERAGEIERAIGYWQQAIERLGLERRRAARLAGLLLARGRLEEALALLDRAKAAVPDDDTDFWRGYAELALRLQEDERAIEAYRRILAQKGATEWDYAGAIELLAPAYPLQAAELAGQAWQRWQRAPMLLRALGLWAQAGRWDAFGRLIGGLSPAQRAQAESDAQFLQLRARYHRENGRPAQALRDIEAALALAPADRVLREALLWGVIDSGDPQRLRALLLRVEADWRREPGLHDALAAGWQYLSEPQRALRYLTPQLGARRDDFLWLMNYADALEQNAEIDRAWRLRETLWRTQRAARPLGDAELETARRVARARLAASQRAGDPGLALLRELLRLDRAGEALPPPVRELALSWLQGAGEYEAARGFLWQQYGRNLARPLWSEIAVALQTDARADVLALIERHGERLPRYDHVNAARRAEDLRLAQSSAFEKQEVQPYDDEMHQALRESLLDYGDSAQVRAARREAGVVSEQPRDIELEIGVSPRLRLTFSLGSTRRASRDAAQIANLPRRENRAGVVAALRHHGGETRLRLAQFDSFERNLGFELERRQTLEGVSLSARFGRRLPASESSALLVAGMKDEVALALGIRLTERERIGLQWQSSRLSGQTGTRFGSGRAWSLEVAHALRLETPDLEASAFVSNSHYRREAGAADAALGVLVPGGGPADAAFFVPDGARLYGLRLSSNLAVRERYGRALRPWFSAALTRSPTLGSGYDLGLGIAGSVFGGDHLQIGWQLNKGGSASFDRTREIGFSYRLHF